MKNTKAIIHDWDDTITSSFETFSKWHFDFSDYHGLPNPTMSNIKEHWGKTVPQLIKGLWDHIPLDAAEQMIYEFVNSYPKHHYTPRIFNGIKNSFIALKEKGCVLGVLSSGDKNSIEKAYVKHLGKYHTFHDFILAAEDSDYHKPNPKVFDTSMDLLSEMGINENETVYVGDSLIDLKAAENRGISFIAITTGITSKKSFTKNGCEGKYVLSDFKEILNLL